MELAKKIEHYCEHGRMESTEETVAPEISAWTSLPGLNASVVRYLYERLQIRTLDDLETLVRSRFVRTLPDVTATDEEILAGIEQLRARRPP
jgi:DNA polymerase/3'-5' exonuclease PolX